MTKSELINKLASRTGASKREVTQFLEAFVGTVTDELKAGSKVAVTGFGTFSVSHRKARTGVNPQNPSERIEIPAVDVPKFTAGKTLKDAIK